MTQACLAAEAPPAVGDHREVGNCNGHFERWADLLILGRNGDDAAYDTFMRELGGWLKRYFNRRIYGEGASDAVQDVLLAVHVGRHSYKRDRPLRPWIAGICRYKFVDSVRQSAKHRSSPLDSDLPLPGHEAMVCSAIIIHDAIAELKPSQRSVIELVKLAGFSVADAAEMTGQSTSLVKVNVHRGLKKVALRLGLDIAA